MGAITCFHTLRYLVQELLVTLTICKTNITNVTIDKLGSDKWQIFTFAWNSSDRNSITADLEVKGYQVPNWGHEKGRGSGHQQQRVLLPPEYLLIAMLKDDR